MSSLHFPVAFASSLPHRLMNYLFQRLLQHISNTLLRARRTLFIVEGVEMKLATQMKFGDLPGK